VNKTNNYHYIRAQNNLLLSYLSTKQFTINILSTKQFTVIIVVRTTSKAKEEVMEKDLTLNELYAALRQLKTKSPGPDGFTNEMLTLGLLCNGQTPRHLQPHLERRTTPTIMERGYHDSHT